MLLYSRNLAQFLQCFDLVTKTSKYKIISKILSGVCEFDPFLSLRSSNFFCLDFLWVFVLR